MGGNGQLPESEILLGNEAIAWGLISAGVDVVTGYPGTPSSEILQAVIRYKEILGLSLHVEWSVNEKVAYEVAYAAAVAGKRAAVTMKQVGLNVAADPFFSSAYSGVTGSLVVVSADDPGPQSSQTEQDSRAFAIAAKVPVLDPSGPVEGLEMARMALDISHEYEVPVLLRPSGRVCHAIEMIRYGEMPETVAARSPAVFRKDPRRWAATPRDRYVLHRELNEKLSRLASSSWARKLNTLDGGRGSTGIIACGVEHAVLGDILDQEALGKRCSVLKVGMPHPVPHALLRDFVDRHEKVLVLENPGPTVESMIAARGKVHGRLDGTVPGEGELTPETVHRIVTSFLDCETEASWASDIERQLTDLALSARKPTLCAGCGHRGAFYALKRALPRAIYTGDIGCYTLGINLDAVDTCLNMGASISMAAGFYHAFRLDGVEKQVVATIGDSTFFHAGLSALANAVYTGARFILMILDNRVTAMTGMQPVPHTGVLADGTTGVALDLEKAVEGCGVRWVRRADPYEIPAFIDLLKEANAHVVSPEGSIAVVIAEHACVLSQPSATGDMPVEINENCDGCDYCLLRFECPALMSVSHGERVEIDRMICVDCGLCVEACPGKHAIVPLTREGS